MKLAVINDLPVAGEGTSGVGSGAELTIGRFQAEGIRRGHHVDVVTAEFATEALLKEYDLVVLKNFVNFNADHLKWIKSRPYVCWPSDYCWTRFRLFFAFQPHMKRLPSLGRIRELFTNSRFNVFLSPLHKEAYEYVMPELAAFPESILSPPPIDPRFLQPRPKDVEWEPNTACNVNGLLPFKGIFLNLDWAYAHPEKKVTFIGSSREGVEMPPNARYVGQVPLGALYEMMIRTETYFEIPATVQPYNNTFAQSIFACKHVVTNENMGAASYEWARKGDKETARREIQEALPNLWARLEKEVPA